MQLNKYFPSCRRRHQIQNSLCTTKRQVPHSHLKQLNQTHTLALSLRIYIWLSETMKEDNRILLFHTGRDASRMMTPSTVTEIVECCMCGDRGLSDELVPCGSCSFRFQHRYCSNQYPDAVSYETCNWCLLNDSSPKGKNRKTSSQVLLNSCSSQQKRKWGNNLDRHLKKRSSPGTPMPRGVVVTDGDSTEEKPAMRRTRPEAVMPMPMTNKGIMKYGLRNRMARRYKLLDEVAT